MTPKNYIPLSKVKKGSIVRILTLPDGLARTQLIRFGIVEGDLVKCLEHLPGGTIVIQKNRQEIALGSKLSHKIIVIIN